MPTILLIAGRIAREWGKCQRERYDPFASPLFSERFFALLGVGSTLGMFVWCAFFRKAEKIFARIGCIAGVVWIVAAILTPAT
jgi:hypothetical protein